MKIAKYIALVFFSFLWLVGCSPELATWLGEKGLIKDDYRYGDLYRLSNLPDFRVPVQKCKEPDLVKSKKVQLVVAGDSFTEKERITQGHFGVEKYDWTFVSSPNYLKLEAGLKKVLVIETVERHLRERFTEPWKEIKHTPIPQQEPPFYQKIIALELPYNTERHESALFGFDFFLTIKEWKATLNHKLFDRIDSKVRLNRTEENLVYYLPSEPGISSAFEPIESEEIEELVKNINATRAHYLAMGFDEVVLSIIPNKTSILASDLGRYNHLVERVQNYPSLKIKTIDMYAPFMRGRQELFDKGDTHWNCEGKQFWIDQLNEIIDHMLETK